MSDPSSFNAVPILYANWRGETAVRGIVPGPLWFGSTEWHPEPQWLMTADEPGSGKRRDFAMSGVKAWGAEAIDAYLVTHPREVTPRGIPGLSQASLAPHAAAPGVPSDGYRVVKSGDV